jgi:hypothetical protein
MQSDAWQVLDSRWIASDGLESVDQELDGKYRIALMEFKAVGWE